MQEIKPTIVVSPAKRTAGKTSFRLLKSEMNLLTATFSSNENSMQSLTAKSDLLGREVEEQRKKIALLESALKNASNSFGENDKRTQSWASKLNFAKAELDNMEKELGDVNSKMEQAKTPLEKLNTELIINKAPSDGFIFPVFNNRSSDINYVGIYSKSKAKPNISMIENVMSCTFTTTSDVEKNNFQTILKTVVDEDLNYNFINNVNDKIKDIIDQNRDETEAVTIDSNKLEDIFSACGLNQDRVNMVKPVYEKLCGDTELTAYNLVDYKTTVDIDGIKVNIKSYDTDKVRTSVIDGRRCLIIDIDDPTVEINGLPVTLN